MLTLPLKSLSLSFIVISSLSCTQHIPDATEPIIVRPSYLSRAFHDDLAKATDAFANQPIVVPLTDYTINSNRQIHWHLSAKSTAPPAIVFLFEPPLPADPTGPIWIEGHCNGTHHDGLQREMAGYTFYVSVTNCRLAQQPTKAAR